MKKTKKILISIIAVVLICVTLISMTACGGNGSSNIVDGAISDYVECVVDLDCDDITTSGGPGAYRYECEGTINIDIDKFSSKNLVFEDVKVRLVIYLSNYWEFSSSSDVTNWSVNGYQMTKIITLSSGGSAHFSTNILLDYESSGLFDQSSQYEVPRVSAYIYKSSGTIKEYK